MHTIDIALHYMHSNTLATIDEATYYTVTVMKNHGVTDNLPNEELISIDFMSPDNAKIFVALMANEYSTDNVEYISLD